VARPNWLHESGPANGPVKPGLVAHLPKTGELAPYGAWAAAVGQRWCVGGEVGGGWGLEQDGGVGQ
jgi:hypothetical protein